MSWFQPSGKYGMHIFTCDCRGMACGDSRRGPDGRSIIFERTEFRSASLKSVLAAQLLAAGWTIAVAPAPDRPIETTLETLASKRDLLFLCPKHRPGPGRVQMP
jgi:hypothetical protein